jgi:hypothetical protein
MIYVRNLNPDIKTKLNLEAPVLWKNLIDKLIVCENNLVLEVIEKMDNIENLICHVLLYGTIRLLQIVLYHDFKNTRIQHNQSISYVCSTIDDNPEMLSYYMDHFNLDYNDYGYLISYYTLAKDKINILKFVINNYGDQHLPEKIKYYRNIIFVNTSLKCWQFLCQHAWINKLWTDDELGSKMRSFLFQSTPTVKEFARITIEASNSGHINGIDHIIKELMNYHQFSDEDFS